MANFLPEWAEITADHRSSYCSFICAIVSPLGRGKELLVLKGSNSTPLVWIGLTQAQLKLFKDPKAVHKVCNKDGLSHFVLYTSSVKTGQTTRDEVRKTLRGQT